MTDTLALGLAAAALQAANTKTTTIDLWVNIGNKKIDSSVTTIRSGGYSVSGVGPATYIADALATSSLNALYPSACKQSADGRWWRLLPTLDSIDVAQTGAMGDPNGLGAVNDRVPIQAAIDYAAAMGIRRVLFTAKSYSIWMTTRTSTFWTYATDGNGLVIPSTLSAGEISLIGTGPDNRTKISFYNKDGTTFPTNTQTIAADGNPWRGAGIFQDTPSVDPGASARPRLCVERLWLEGGTVANGNTNWTNPATDVLNGWDTSHKGIWVRPDRYNGDLILRDVKVTGFRGELVYSGNHIESSMLLDGYNEFAETNGQSINPNCGNVQCLAPFVAWNVNLAFEGWGGHGKIWGKIYNVLTSSSVLSGGIRDQTAATSYWKPQRSVNAPFSGMLAPLEIDLEITSSQKLVCLGSFLRGKVTLIDTTAYVPADSNIGPFKLGVTDQDLEILTFVDKADLQTALVLVASATSGSKNISDCRYRVILRRTAAAITAGYTIVDAVTYSGSFGPGVVVEHSSGTSKRGSHLSGTFAALPDYYPCFRDNQFDAFSDFSQASQNVATTPAIIPCGDFLALGAGGATNTVTAITLPTTGISDGHELTLLNNTPQSNYWAFSIDRASSGARVPAKRLVTYGDNIKLKYDATINLWREIKAPHPINAYASVTFPALAANAISAIQTFTLPGAQIGMDVKICNWNPSSQVEIIQAQITANNTVSYRIREVSGAAYAGGSSIGLIVYAEWRYSW